MHSSTASIEADRIIAKMDKPLAGERLLRKSCLVAAAIAALGSAPAAAWGDLGHKVTALIAYRHLTPQARLKLDALLAADTDGLTPPDFANRATWADKYRSQHRETAAWHFVDIEIDAPDLQSACFDFPALSASQPASQGPAEDCVVNKIEEFAAELQSAATPPAERQLALKFLIHFIGDLHQPLHAADHGDRGGNCIGLTGVERSAARRARPICMPTGTWLWSMRRVIQPSKLPTGSMPGSASHRWPNGLPARRAAGPWRHSRSRAATPMRCHRNPHAQPAAAVALSEEYRAAARNVAATQLQKAAIRMASMLNRLLGT